ncbi:PREDICTED: hemicentin-2-like [Priapulus caudatus]|uniref:Hemicentin-2-like n=1 Tax=Priapulus caudatus TaxID=37621 RepID=A0ABM1EV90_PRICU|nr:PREDICTED: hemicentin-2-like [Priapulus caudatus]
MLQTVFWGVLAILAKDAVEAVSFKREPSNLTLNVGDTGVLGCAVDAQEGDMWSVQWYRDGKGLGNLQLYGRYEYKDETHQDNDYDLVISDAMLVEDNAEFVCQIDQGFTLVDGATTLIGSENETISCVTKNCNPVPKVTWWKQRKESDWEDITNTATSETIEETFDGEQVATFTFNNSLTFVSERLDNGGRLSCRVDHPSYASSGVLELTIDMNVMFVPAITGPQQDADVVEGTDAEFSCVIDANPPASVSWYRGVNVISNDNTLKIEQASLYDESDDYRCLAENDQGSTYSPPFTITLLVPPTDLYMLQDGVVIDETSPAIFTSDQMAVISCHAENSKPTSSFRWLLNGTDPQWTSEVEHVPGNRNQTETSVSTVTFIALKEYNLDTVTCDVIHPAIASGSLQSNMEVMYSPQITMSPQPTEIDEGERLELECASDGHPTPAISWMKGATVIQSDTPLLIFAEISRDDEGTYACSATNDLGSDKSREFAITVIVSKGGMIAGIIIAIIVVIVILAVVGYLYWKRKLCFSAKSADGVDEACVDSGLHVAQANENQAYRCDIIRSPGSDGGADIIDENRINSQLQRRIGHPMINSSIGEPDDNILETSGSRMSYAQAQARPVYISYVPPPMLPVLAENKSYEYLSERGTSV